MSSSEAVPLPAAPEQRPQEYVADVSFADLGLSPELSKAIAERGYQNPTPVQAKAFGPVMAGKDVIVRSKTGTGKTAAFGIPLLEKLSKGERGVRALIMCPTRELALQVAAELTSLAKYRDVQVAAIYGGASMKQQEDALRDGASIIVGTPGRVYDHIRRKNLDLSTCTHAILDEADEMLNQGFYEEVTRILDHMPKNRQVLLFSATVPEDIQRLIAKYTTDAETLLLSGDVYTVDHITHVRYDLSDAYPKPRNLIYVLEMEQPENAIVFCNTRDDTELVTAVLNRNGFDAELLNGDLPQKERERVMAKVKRGEVAFMVATDIAARGIDISDLKFVINYSLPEDPAVYLHRVGRTGRIGKTGVALNLVSGRELTTLTTLERKYNIKFEKRAMPSPEDALKLWTDRHVSQLKDAALGSVTESFLELANQLKRRPDADELIAFMLKFFFAQLRKDRAREEGVPDRSTERGERLSDKKNDRGGGREGRGERGGRRGERGERGDREDRGPRREARSDRGERSDRPPREHRETREHREPREAVTDPAVPAVSAASATTQPDQVAAAAPTPKEPPRRHSHGSSGHRPKAPTDREIFEALQSGKPLPVIADPTGDATDEATAHVPAGEGSDGRERRDRTSSRRRRETSKPVAAPEGQSRVWINLGTLDGLDPTTIGPALEAQGAPAGALQRAEVLRAFSYLFVADESVAAFEALSGKKQGEKAIRAERARK